MSIDFAGFEQGMRDSLLSRIQERLPKAWRLFEVAQGDGDADLVGQLETPNGNQARLLVEVKQTVDRRDVSRLEQRLKSLAESNDVPVVAARYLSPSVRQALIDADISFADATGNIDIRCDDPALFISDRGLDRDPWRKGRPPGNLKGEPAARVVRALLDSRRDWRVRELIAESGASSGATYRVLDYLQREELVAKSEGQITVTDWERLLRTWSADAPFTATTRTMAFIDPRGIENFLGRITEKPHFPVAVTGAVASHEWVTYAPAKAAYVYVSSIQEASTRWGLRANTAAPNIILLEPATVGDVPFRGARAGGAGYPIAAPTQVAADLLNGPGRDPAEGEALIEWMRDNEEAWRHGE